MKDSVNLLWSTLSGEKIKFNKNHQLEIFIDDRIQFCTFNLFKGIKR